MHKQKNKPDIFIIGSDDFINSLKELKEDLQFNIIEFNDYQENSSIKNNEILMIDNSISFDAKQTNLINLLKASIKILIGNSVASSSINHNLSIKFPIKIHDFNKIIIGKISGNLFNKNSSLPIKDYVLDKNERKLKKNNLFIILTEKEIHLLEVLLNAKEPINKKKILTEVWKYASDADTHTVETHIYRLRKKIIEKFNDEDFLISQKTGYLI